MNSAKINFLDSMAEESEDEMMSDNHITTESEEEDDDEERLKEEFKDLIDDDPIEEDTDGEENLASSSSRKRRRRDSDHRLDEEDYQLLEENLGVTVERKRFKRFKRIVDSEDEKEAIEDELFSKDAGSSCENRRETCRPAAKVHQYEEESSEDETSDGFIVDDDGGPIVEKEKGMFTDSALQEAQDIFGVDFDYAAFEKYGDDRKEEKTTKRKSIFEVYEPSDLKRGHFTDLDNDIRVTDVPERMQLRSVPVTVATEEVLAAEAQWIYDRAFESKTISKQDADLNVEARKRAKKGPQTVAKIARALHFMRNENLEVPFISFYRKEYVLPELNVEDLWKVYKFDAQWCQLLQRKQALLALFCKMKVYQQALIMKHSDSPFTSDNMRLIQEEDVKQLENAQTTEELNDCYHHFMLYYSHEIPKMQEMCKQEQDKPAETLKRAVRTGPYSIYRRAGLESLAKRFGLRPEQFSKNLTEEYQVFEVQQDPNEPRTIAAEYVGEKFQTAEEVLKAAQFMVAMQLAREPLLRESVRKMYKQKAKISVRPTKQGIKSIDEYHPLFSMKYLKDKPVKDLKGDQYLKLAMAEEDKLISISFSDIIEGTNTNNYVEQMKQLYARNEFSKIVQDWNALRVGSVEIALTQMVIPDLKKELHSMLLSEAKECVMRSCTRKARDWIEVAPYTCEFPHERGEQWDTTEGLRVMGLAYVPDFSIAAYACLVAPNGECADYLKLPHLLKKKNSYRREDRVAKEADILALKKFITAKKPHVVVIGGESRDALMIAEDVRKCIAALVSDKKFPEIGVEIVDNNLATIYSNSVTGVSEFRDYPVELRQAISLARRLQDPLVEFSRLCNADNEILCLRYHSLQDQLPKEELLENINLEFVNRVNEVGVDINRAVQQPAYSGNLLQYVCGLGARKAQHLVKILKNTEKRCLENRSQLVTSCHMGPRVFVNSAGFMKIDTDSLDDGTEVHVDELDGSRVHPEAYVLARKMAADALGYDSEATIPAGVVDKILQSPEKLDDLDLDAYAKELERQGFGSKRITLYDIRSELSSRYKDERTPYRSPTPEKLFEILTKETPESFYIGKLVEATVTGFSYRKSQGKQLDAAAPGKACGIQLRLDNGISGFIHTSNLSDKFVANPEERVRVGQRIHCRIVKINADRFGVEATSKSSDLADKHHTWRPRKDPHYDTEAEIIQNLTEEAAKKAQQRPAYVQRLIVHPSFQNITYADAEELMKTKAQGDAIIRPSSKGSNHLTVTWKVTDDVHQHIDVLEEGKENAHSLGRSLRIGKEEFEDLDEILARHVDPMAASVRELMRFRSDYYVPHVMGMQDRAEAVLRDLQSKNAKKTHYIISPSKNYPGYFVLSYLPRSRCIHEYITVVPDGFIFRKNRFPRFSDLITWFKEHFNARASSAVAPTTTEVNQEIIRRVARNMPEDMLQSLSHAMQQRL